ncbi:hypothetical protein LC653_28805 [Nostoc sp. CHAB 5784]|uniref:hypothetical protein n=1 Tax=Nostoc mirabile TaxID=2907820 RepID=UPI001E51E918|nr:hypothetical protein [Nostoc mirabile]MCC5667771.1 hypothetical protein [Nostoc mirabile CHAB5784]
MNQALDEAQCSKDDIDLLVYVGVGRGELACALLQYIHPGFHPGQTHLKYKNPLIARVWAFQNLGYFFINILVQQWFQKLGAFALSI